MIFIANPGSRDLGSPGDYPCTKEGIYMWGQHIFMPDLVEAGMIWIQYYQLEVFVPIGSESGAAATTESFIGIDWNEVIRRSAAARRNDWINGV